MHIPRYPDISFFGAAFCICAIWLFAGCSQATRTDVVPVAADREVSPQVERSPPIVAVKRREVEVAVLVHPGTEAKDVAFDRRAIDQSKRREVWRSLHLGADNPPFWMASAHAEIDLMRHPLPWYELAKAFGVRFRESAAARTFNAASGGSPRIPTFALQINVREPEDGLVTFDREVIYNNVSQALVNEEIAQVMAYDRNVARKEQAESSYFAEKGTELARESTADFVMEISTVREKAGQHHGVILIRLLEARSNAAVLLRNYAIISNMNSVVAIKVRDTGFLERAAKNILTAEVVAELREITHPSGKAGSLESITVGSEGENLYVDIRFSWQGGLIGRSYKTVVRWLVSSDAHIQAKVLDDNASFKVKVSNLEKLNVLFRDQLWPKLQQELKTP